MKKQFHSETVDRIYYTPSNGASSFEDNQENEDIHTYVQNYGNMWPGSAYDPKDDVSVYVHISYYPETDRIPDSNMEEISVIYTKNKPKNELISKFLLAEYNSRVALKCVFLVCSLDPYDMSHYNRTLLINLPDFYYKLHRIVECKESKTLNSTDEWQSI